MDIVNYLPRIVDAELDELLAGLSALSLEGPKGVGKTVTSARRAGSTIRLDDPDQRHLLRVDPERLDRGPFPVLIDEWQREPSVWDAVRRRVDADPTPNRFLLTGSASPVSSPTHSGAGRIVQVRMRPLSLAERGLPAATVSLSTLLEGGRLPISSSTDVTLTDYAEQIVSSGFPGIRGLPGRTRRAQLEGYLVRVVEHDFPEQGRLVRRPSALRSWLRAYAAATATTSSYTTILDAATPGESDKPARSTTIGYRDVLSQLWLLDPVEGWSPSGSALGRLAVAPKHHLVDPGLAAAILGADVPALLGNEVDAPPIPRDGPLLGALFESLVTLSVRVYAQSAEAAVSHLRTRNGDHEVDLLVSRRDRRLVAFEVKLARVVEDRDVRHLHWLRERLGDQLLDAAVITAGSHAYRRPDGIAVVPAALLGP